MIDRHPRSKRLSEAFREGALRMGWKATVTDEQHDAPRADLCAAYGWLPHSSTLLAYRSAGLDFLYCDLGFWGRKRQSGDYDGFHKVALNDRHPTAYFRRNRPHDRLEEAPDVHPWRGGGKHVLLAGLSAKGAVSVGQRPLEWERKTIAALRKVTRREIVYRPKPSWRDAQPIPGVGYSPPTQSIEAALSDASAVVTHYSNCALDGLMAGIPAYAELGVATALSAPSLAALEAASAISIGARRQFLADVSYCHWRRTEIADGKMFRQFVDDGLIAV